MENRLSLPLAGFGVLSALLGSSCCVIQLFLNLFAVGCAGFAVLDPYSGILNALSAASLSYNFWLNYQYSGRFYNKNLLISVVLAILFAIAPTVVNRVNNPVVKPQTKEIHLKVEGKHLQTPLHSHLHSYLTTYTPYIPTCTTYTSYTPYMHKMHAFHTFMA
eukprot:TRINITY_DN4367_c0_g1_i1.p1 TRINITY_DN4367_c0_g1~~TRINITY_DN4367_c0_g1_i1.p1  ORF type:complete len:175 (+),score=3.68 TRINITY_DN4367_c0_g1_i1:42-527(+)